MPNVVFDPYSYMQQKKQRRLDNRLGERIAQDVMHHTRFYGSNTLDILRVYGIKVDQLIYVARACRWVNKPLVFWITLCKTFKLPCKFLIAFENVIPWQVVFKYQTLDTEFFENATVKLTRVINALWPIVVANQNLSKDFIVKNKEVFKTHPKALESLRLNPYLSDVEKVKLQLLLVD